MRITRLGRAFRLAPLVVAVVFCSTAWADEGQDHQHLHEAIGAEALGTVHFPVSCKADVQPAFNRAVALLHSFGYELAAAAFTDIATKDLHCAMAQWGLAMTQFHPVWVPPTEAELKAGREAAVKAAALIEATGTPNARERGYVAAIGTFYSGDDVSFLQRCLAYERSMDRLSVADPQHHEAAIFHALAILGVAYASPPDKTYAGQKRAAAILNGLLPVEPNHPGIAHYMIHAFDFPALAELALPAARAYAKIAPDAPHALHMPSHIFTRLGLWDESIASNIASAKSADRQIAAAAIQNNLQAGATSYNALHAMDYLEYAYLQTGRDAKAGEIAAAVARVTALDVPSFSAGYAIAAVPARSYALERRRWAEAAALTVAPPPFPWAKVPYAEAITHFARAVGAARAGDLPAARLEVQRLSEIQAALAAGPKGAYDFATQVEIQRRASAGWLARAEGKNDEALALLRSAADLEGSTDKHPVTPGAVLPAREQLADLLLDLGRPSEALVAYEATLQESPKRFRSLYGAAHAAELAGARVGTGPLHPQRSLVTSPAPNPASLRPASR